MPSTASTNVKQETERPSILGNNFQGRPWENRGGYKPRATAYQESTNSHQDQSQDDNEMRLADATKTSFANQDLQMLTDNGYKDHK